MYCVIRISPFHFLLFLIDIPAWHGWHGFLCQKGIAVGLARIPCSRTLHGQHFFDRQIPLRLLRRIALLDNALPIALIFLPLFILSHRRRLFLYLPSTVEILSAAFLPLSHILGKSGWGSSKVKHSPYFWLTYAGEDDAEIYTVGLKYLVTCNLTSHCYRTILRTSLLALEGVVHNSSTLSL